MNLSNYRTCFHDLVCQMMMAASSGLADLQALATRRPEGSLATV